MTANKSEKKSGLTATLDILGTIDDRYNSFDGILGTGGDRTIQCKVLSAAADRMSFDRPSPSAEDLASDIEEYGLTDEEADRIVDGLAWMAEHQEA